MPGIADKELVEQLNAFMRAVLELWTWDQLAALGNETHVEYRGNDENLLTFDLQLLENQTEGRPYLNVSVSVCDLRETGLGSAYEPFCTNFIFYKDGELDLEYKTSLTPNY
jgi:hypothetical protein